MAAVRNQSAEEMGSERGFTFEAVVAEELNSFNELATESDDDDVERRAMLRAQELESVDFYIAQGYADIAVDTLDLLERQFGEHADIQRRRDQLKIIAEGGSLPAEASTHV